MAVQDKAVFWETVVISETEVFSVMGDPTMATKEAFLVKAVFWEMVVFSKASMITSMATTTTTTHMDPCQTTLMKQKNWHRIH